MVKCSSKILCGFKFLLPLTFLKTGVNAPCPDFLIASLLLKPLWNTAYMTPLKLLLFKKQWSWLSNLWHFFLLVCALQVLENHSLFNQGKSRLKIKIFTYFFNENFKVLLFILGSSFDLELIFVVWCEVKDSIRISDLIFNFLSTIY